MATDYTRHTNGLVDETIKSLTLLFWTEVLGIVTETEDVEEEMLIVEGEDGGFILTFFCYSKVNNSFYTSSNNKQQQVTTKVLAKIKILNWLNKSLSTHYADA